MICWSGGRAFGEEGGTGERERSGGGEGWMNHVEERRMVMETVSLVDVVEGDSAMEMQ